MITQKNIPGLLLCTGIVLCLLQVWLPQYYLTGDGPCHVYNAQVLHDLWAHKNVAFYTRFYNLVYQPNPNWLSTAAIAALMFLVQGAIAEKIFLTIYVLLFVSGFHLLLKKISKNASYLALLVLFFVFPWAVAKGFYNFSFSIAFYFWAVWGWLHFLEKRNLANAGLFFLFIFLAFFTHLLAFIFGGVTCGALAVTYALAGAGKRNKPGAFRALCINAGFLALLLLPFALLMRWFTEKEGGMHIHLVHHFYRLIELVQFKYIVNVSHRENLFAAIAGITLLLLFAASFISIKLPLKVNKYDGFLISLGFVLFVYLFFPEAFMGHLILIAMRVQLYVFILVACCISYRLPPGTMGNTGGLILFGCFIAVSIVRIPCQMAASEGAADYVSGVGHIRPYSVVLPLDFSPNGKDKNGAMIADRNFPFCHASQYMGTDRPLIILDNYEANMGYFPLCWTERTNPYNHLSRDAGIEGQPPGADIESYRQVSGVNIDYILMWCYDPSYLRDEQFRKLYTEIKNGYHIVYTSASGRTVLYEQDHRP